MKTVDITPKDYAKWRGCTLQNVTKHLRAGNELPHVIDIKRYSRFYLLVVPEGLLNKSPNENKGAY